jgi:hypothetical protein
LFRLNGANDWLDDLGRFGDPIFIRAHQQSSLIYVLSTGSKAAARGVAEHVLAAWYDLSHYTAGPEALKFISLFDDSVDVWTEKELNLVSDLSDIAIWSRPDDLYNQIAA